MEECEVYNKILNIDLFNKIVTFISDTTKIENKYQILSEIENRCIWYQMKSSMEFQEEYRFEYLGELLERYEERIGNDIRDVRAIALALGYAKKLIENEMFIGTQLVDFLLKIKNLAQNDIYLKGALYLYDKNTYSHYGDIYSSNMLMPAEGEFAIYIEKETGLTVKNKNGAVVNENGTEEPIVIDYEYKFDSVTDEDLVETDISEYQIQENN